MFNNPSSMFFCRSASTRLMEPGSLPSMLRRSQESPQRCCQRQPRSVGSI